MEELDLNGIEPKLDLSGIPKANAVVNPMEHINHSDNEIIDVLAENEDWHLTLNDTIKEWGKAAKLGYEGSITGMIATGKEADYNSVRSSFMTDLIRDLTMNTIDMPYYLAGFALGAAGSGGNPAMGVGGAMALPAGIRKTLVDRIRRGEIKNMDEFKYRMAGSMKETLKGQVSGMAGGLAKGAAPLIAKLPAEVVSMTATSAFLEGRLPTIDEFKHTSMVMMALGAGSHLVGKATAGANEAVTQKLVSTYADKKTQRYIEDKLLSTYEKHGIRPEDVYRDAQNDMSILEDILSTNIETPRAYEGIDQGKIVEPPATEGVENSGKPKFRTEMVEGKSEKTSIKQRAKETAKKLKTEMLDDLHPLKSWVQDITGKKGQAMLDVIDDPYKMFRLYRGIGGKFEHMYEYGLWDMNNFKVNSKGFREIMNSVDDVEGFGNYMIARRALYLHSQGHRTGMERFDTELMDWNDKGKNNTKWVKAAADFDQMMNSSLKMLKDSGVISGKGYADLVNKSKYYLPFKRVIDTKGNARIKGNVTDPVKGLTEKGSDLPIKDPFHTTMQEITKRLVMAEKNFTHSSLIRFARKYDPTGMKVKEMERRESQDYLTEADQKELKAALKYKRGEKAQLHEKDSALNFVVEFTNKKGQTQKGLVMTEYPEQTGDLEVHYISKTGDYGIETINRGKMKFLGKQSNPDVKLPIPEDPIDAQLRELGIDPDNISNAPHSPQERGVIAVYEDGQLAKYKIDPEIADIVNRLGYEDLQLVDRILQKPTAWLRAGATLNLDFASRNVVRDVLSSMVFGVKSGIRVPFLDFGKGLMESINKGEQYKMWLRSGGAQSMLISMDKPHFEREIYEELQQGDYQNKVSKSPMEWLRTVSEYSERGTRIGEFKRMIKNADLNDRRAILNAGFESRDVTLDFRKAGTWGRKVNRWVAFFNAAIQGNLKMVEMLSHGDPAIRKAAWLKAGIYITVPSIGLAMMTHNHPAIKELPQWQKDIFWCIPLGKGKDATVIRIPKPFELGILFGTIPERIINSMMGDGLGAFDDILETLATQMPAIVPTPVLPLAENKANYSVFRDRPQIPQSELGKLPEYRYTEYTSEIAKKLSKAIGSIGLGEITDHYSPIEIENIVAGYTGGLGKYAMQILDAAGRKSGVLDDPVRPEWALSDVPIIKAFVARHPSSSATSLHKFNERFAKYKQVVTTINGLQKDFNFDESFDLLKDSDLNTLRTYDQAIKNIYQMISMTLNMPLQEGQSRSELARVKRQTIDKMYFQMIEIAKQGNETLDMLEEWKKEYKELNFK